MFIKGCGNFHLILSIKPFGKLFEMSDRIIELICELIKIADTFDGSGLILAFDPMGFLEREKYSSCF